MRNFLIKNKLKINSNFIMNITRSNEIETKKGKIFKKKNNFSFNNLLVIESRNFSRKRDSSFLKKKHLLKEDNLPKRKESSLSPEKIFGLMNSLSKAENYLKTSTTHKKFRLLKKKIEPFEFSTSIPKSHSITKKIKERRSITPAKIPRSGLIINYFYNHNF